MQWKTELSFTTKNIHNYNNTINNHNKNQIYYLHNDETDIKKLEV